jgi:antirestriction protein ArdC
MAKEKKSREQRTEEATQKIAAFMLSQLETMQIAPWRKPWIVSGVPTNPNNSFDSFSGANRWLLTMYNAKYTSNEWSTYNQWMEKGYEVAKGEKGACILKPMRYSIDDPDEDGKKISIASSQHFNAYYVFNREQTDAPKREVKELRREWNVHEKADQIVSEYTTRDNVKVNHYDGDRAFYLFEEHSVNVPQEGQFETQSDYYDTLFHELSHSTSRSLNRNLDKYGSDTKCRGVEEITAEMGSAIILGMLGITDVTKGDISNDETAKNELSYLQSWIDAIKNDPKLLTKGIQQAHKASQHILQGTEIVASI